MGRDVSRDHGIGANAGVVSNCDLAQDFGTGSDVDMPANGRKIVTRARANCHLLENQAIDTDHGARVDHDPVGMWKEQAAANVTVQGDIGTGYHAPEPMPKDENFADKKWE